MFQALPGLYPDWGGASEIEGCVINKGLISDETSPG